MKKYIVLILFLISNLTIWAQLHYGLKAGANISNIHFSEMSIIKYKPGVNVGLYSNININKHIDLQSEILYSQQGYIWKVHSKELDIKIKTKALCHNINIPIFVKYYIYGRSLFLELGPQLGFQLKNRYTTNRNDLLDKNAYWPRYHTCDISALFGVGFNFTEKVSANLRYCQGLTSAIKNQDHSTNQVFQLSISYELH